MLTLPICLFGIPLAPTIVRVVYGPAFGPAAVVLQILLVSLIFSVLGQASQSALLGVESHRWLVKTGIAAAVLSIGLDLALIPRWGAIGAAVANTTVQGIWALAIFAPLWKRLFGVSRRAIAKTAAVAGGLAAVLSLFVVLGPATLTVTLASVLIVTTYGVTLHRLKLIRPLPEGNLIGH
jgi:O-antigen/teichoic acid export membrane protein